MYLAVDINVFKRIGAPLHERRYSLKVLFETSLAYELAKVETTRSIQQLTHNIFQILVDAKCSG